MRLIEIGGQRRPVLFTNNALVELEQLTGVSVFDTKAIAGVIRSVTGCRALVYVGLKYGHRRTGEKFDYSIEAIGDWIDFNGNMLSAVMDAFMEDTASIFPKEKATEDSGKKN